MSADKLYTSQMLGAAMSLAEYPPLPEAPLHGEARSATCGSTLAMDLVADEDGLIDGIGMKVTACAVGQASAATFANHAAGKGLAQLEATRDAIVAWLGGQAALPDWPGLQLIEPAQGYAARHGAILLPWNAAIAALSTRDASS